MSFSAQCFYNLSLTMELSPFDSHFGTEPKVVAIVWNMMEKPKGARPKHLLWTLLFLKLYSNEDVLKNMAKTSKNTFRKWTELILVELYKLEPKLVSHPITTFFNFIFFKSHFQTCCLRSNGGIGS
jgi:hypothetical protein